MTAHAQNQDCQACWPAIDDAVDGTLPVAARAALEHHLAACEACAQRFADLSQIRRAAASLPPRYPRADAWDRIATALAQQRPSAAAVTPSAWWWTRRAVLAAAAVLVLAVSSAMWLITWPGTKPAAPAPSAAPASASAPAPVNPPAGNLVKSVDEELKAAEAHYEKAIEGLEQIAKADEHELDPATARTLKTNLGIIDQAIRDSRSALQTQPSSQLAQDSLFEALQRKVNLLEDTIALINVMRKGDQAGTARIVQGASKS